MELILENALQHQIADLLWVADSEEAANAIVAQFGRDGVIVREMMIAAAMDEIMDTDLVQEVLRGL